MPESNEKEGANRARNNNNRRSNKPLMEKRRRARINHSLAELKSLIIDACVKKDQSNRSSKLEKADILEMTVRHVKSLQRAAEVTQQPQNVLGEEEEEVEEVQNDGIKFEAGFRECARQVTSFLDSVDGVDGQLRRRLANHLIKRQSQLSETDQNQQVEQSKSGLDVSLRCPSNNGLQLIPTRLLPTGEIAFMWPFDCQRQPLTGGQWTKKPSSTSSSSSTSTSCVAMWRPW